MATAVMTMPDIPSATPLMLTASSTSRRNIKLYKVKNVDDNGKVIHAGYLEITSTHIVFQYQQYSMKALKWPLTCIRKWGTSSNGHVFIFEAGRRAPEGEGMYAFKTKKAEEIRRKLNDYTKKL